MFATFVVEATYGHDDRTGTVYEILNGLRSLDKISNLKENEGNDLGIPGVEYGTSYWASLPGGHELWHVGRMVPGD